MDNLLHIINDYITINTQSIINNIFKKDRINMLQTLIKLFPNEAWNGDELSRNKNITWSFIIEHLDKQLNWKYITSKKDVTPAIINKYNRMIYVMQKDCIKQIIWDWSNMHENPNIDWNFICANLNMPWDWCKLSAHKCIIPRDVINNYPNVAWNWAGLSKNPNLDWEFIAANLDKPWNWAELSKHKCITPEIVNKYPNLSWNWYYMSYNPNLTWEFVRENCSTKSWDMCGLSAHKCVTPSNITKYNTLSWDWQYISRNPNLTCEFVMANLDEDNDWDWYSVLKICDIPLEVVANNLTSTYYADLNYDIIMNAINGYNILNSPKPWDWGELETNPNLIWDHILANLEDEWEWSYLSMFIDCDTIDKHSDITYWIWDDVSANPTITIEFINKYKDKINFTYLSRNDFYASMYD